MLYFEDKRWKRVKHWIRFLPSRLALGLNLILAEGITFLPLRLTLKVVRAKCRFTDLNNILSFYSLLQDQSTSLFIPTASGGAAVSIPGRMLVPGATYTFTLTVSKPGREEAHTTQMVSPG